MKRFDLIVICIIGVVSFLLLSIGIDKPFNGHHDFNNRFFSQVGRNYLKYGHLNLKLGQLIWNHDPSDPGEIFYTHHPPLLPVLLSGSIKILGDSVRSVRLVPIIFSVLTLVVFYLFGRRFFGAMPTGLGIIAWIISPMFLYFGKMANYEALSLFFTVFTIWQYALWREKRNTKNFRLVMLGLFLGQWTFWPAYYLAGILFLFSRKWEFLALSLVNFGLFMVNIMFITGSPIGGGLLEVFLFRVGLQSESPVAEAYTPLGFLSQELRWSYHFFTPAVFILTLLALGMSTLTWFRNKKIDLYGQMWLIFFGVAGIHVVLFQTGAFHHDFWLYYFLPFYAWGVTSMTKMLTDRFKTMKGFVYGGIFGILALAFYWSQPFFWALQTMVIVE